MKTMTKYWSLTKAKQRVKPTVFTHYITSSLRVNRVNLYGNQSYSSPEDYGVVIHIGYDSCYGDVFKAVKTGESADFVIFFGEKGDENYESL